MRGFSGYAQAPVTLARGDESITFTLRPLPFGYQDVAGVVMPPPKPALGQEKPDEAALAKWHTRRGMIFLAKCLGDQLDTKAPPEGAKGGAWEAYADAVLAEFQAAHLVEGDLQKLLDAMGGLNRGLGELPKA